MPDNLHLIIYTYYSKKIPSHILQKFTWSNYKHDDILKILVLVASVSQFLILVLNAFVGVIPGNTLTKYGFLDHVDPYTVNTLSPDAIFQLFRQTHVCI